MSRKYRQRGYQEEGEKSRKGGRRSASRGFKEGPRSPRMTTFQEAFRCGVCGASLPPSFTEITISSECPQCSEDLHTCKNCTFFDPGSRFECSEVIPERVYPKDKRNECEYFEPRTTVEKSVSSNSTPTLDPREAFERLFKK